MKRVLLFICITATFFSANAGTISLGYFSQDVLLWRFWEIDSSGTPKPKILVYNISNKPVSFIVKKTNSRGGIEPAEKAMLASRFHLLTDTIVQEVIVGPHSHSVYDIAVLKGSGLYDAVLINWVYCGIMPELQEVNIDKYTSKYYSYEGVAGSMNCLISKNNLFTERGQEDNTTLFFDCTYKPFNEKSRELEARINDGVEMVSLYLGTDRYELSETNKRTEFVVNIEHIPSFTINMIYKIGRNDLVPGIRFHNRIPERNFNMDCWIPVFVK